MQFSWRALCSFVIGGAAAGWFVSDLVPAALRQPHLHGRDFVLERKADRAVEVKDASWWFVPWLFGDFDLHMDVELGAGVDFDLLLRQVEPRAFGSALRPFQGRFSALRLSTRENGPAWYSRDDLLRGERRGGVDLAPGLTATVSIQARGRVLTANVAGKQLGSFVTDDEYGMLALVTHGGTAVVHNLVVTDRGQGRAWLWSRWLWLCAGAIGGAITGAIASALGGPRIRFVAGAVVPAALAWLLARRVDLELGWPPPLAMVALLAGCLLGALPDARRPLWRRLFLPACAASLLIVFGLHGMGRDTRVADAMFGPRAGSQLSEAHAQLVRGPGGLHDVRAAEKRVFLLGGQMLYDRGLPAEHLELLVGRDLRAALKQPVDVPCLPTVDGYAPQQWRLFTRFFTGFRPNVIVLGVAAGELADDPVTGEPRSSRQALVDTVRAAREHCRASGAKLVLFAERAVPPELHGALREAERDAVPLVFADDGDLPPAIAKKLAAAILPLLE